MQQIYRQADEQLEIYTTVFSPQVCRSRTRSRHTQVQQMVVAAARYQSQGPKELDLNPGDRIQVLFKEDEGRWFGRLSDGRGGYFPAFCVEPPQGGDSSGATTPPLRRGSEPGAETDGAPCGCSSGNSSPRRLGRNGFRRLSGLSSPGLLHRVLDKSRRKSCPQLPPSPHLGPSPHLPTPPHLPRPPAGQVNESFLPDH